MKNIIALIFFLLPASVFGQKYFTKSGLTEFKASVAAFEPVEAKNNSTTAILDCSKSEVAALIFINAFHFEVALMEEHFNENYMESDKHPKATFKGILKDFTIEELSEESKTFLLEGDLKIKGISNTIATTVSLKMEEGRILVFASFPINPTDYEIEIPSIVRNKISENITISLEYELVEKK